MKGNKKITNPKRKLQLHKKLHFINELKLYMKTKAIRKIEGEITRSNDSLRS